jgi:ribose 1,5-bisphosphate isomerase
MVLTDTADKIKSMEIRGAGRIARAAALALAEHAESLGSTDITEFSGEMKRAADLMAGTRPTECCKYCHGINSPREDCA